jgi:hypothetical protein
MCAENAANGMEFARTYRISYGKSRLFSFICWLEMFLAILSNLLEIGGMERRPDDPGRREAAVRRGRYARTYNCACRPAEITLQDRESVPLDKML